MKKLLLLNKIHSVLKKAYFLVSLFVLLFCQLRVKAQQNLIPDPSFENYVQCPQMPNVFNNFLLHWKDPTNCSSDYFNVCSSVFSVPNTPLGHQIPKSGSGFVGIACESYNPPNIASYGREYIQTRLTDTLKANKKYCVSFFVNLPDRIKYTTSRIGAYIGEAIPSVISCPPQPIYTPQIQNQFGSFISDTINWTKISGVYLANGTEEYLTIGNFYTPSNTDTLKFNPNSGVSGVYVYFYIDEVSVVELSVEAGRDTSICIGQSVTLGEVQNDTSFHSYYWYANGVLIDSLTNFITVSPSTNTTYVLEKRLCESVYDTVVVTVNCVGIKENQIKSKTLISSYPNPASNEVNFVFNVDVEQIKIEIINILGVKQEVKATITTNGISLNTALLEAGTYICKIYQSGNLIQNEKIVIIK